MDRADGHMFRSGLFFGLGFLPLTGATLAFTGDPGPGLFVVTVGAVLIGIAVVDWLIFKHRHPERKVP